MKIKIQMLFFLFFISVLSVSNVAFAESCPKSGCSGTLNVTYDEYGGGFRHTITKSCSKCGYSTSTTASCSQFRYLSASSTQHTKTCSQCGAESLVSHSLSTKAATCTSGGSESCSVCEYSKTTSALGHNYVDSSASGHKCTRCSTAASHNYGSYQTVTDASCETDGTQRRVCKVCNRRQVSSIPATGHSWGEWKVTTKPTCSTKGVQTRVCANNASHTETQETNFMAEAHKDDSPCDGYCDYNQAHDLNTAPVLTIMGFSKNSYKKDEKILLTLQATKGTNKPETWDSLSVIATMGGVSGFVEANGLEAGTESAMVTVSWNAEELFSSLGTLEATVIATDSRGLQDTKNTEEISIETGVIGDTEAPILEDIYEEIMQNQGILSVIVPKNEVTISNFFVVSKPEYGVIELDEKTGEWSYSPNDDYFGEDTIKIKAMSEEGKVSNEATIHIRIRKPLEEIDIVSKKQKNIRISKNTSYNSPKLPNKDKNGDGLFYSIQEGTTNGEIIWQEDTKQFIYTPNKDFVGNDFFTLIVTTGRETLTIHFTIEVLEEGEITDQVHTWYMQGYEDGTIRPDGKVTREEIAMILYRLLDDPISDEEVHELLYTDLSPDRWSYKAIVSLTDKKIIIGYANNTFKPTAAITRAELATMLERFASLKANTSVHYTDVGKEHWARLSIMKVTTNGLMEGYKDGSFKPQNQLTRAEAATVINRLLGRKGTDMYAWKNPFSDLKTSHWAYKEMLEAVTTHTFTWEEDGLEEWSEYEYPY